MKIEHFEEVRSLLGTPSPIANKKIYTYLHQGMVEFINLSPLLFLSTVDLDGFPTISPKGDHPGFVMTENNRFLYIPERKGNRLAFSFHNILAGSKVGVLFVVPGTNEVLRVHGSAELIDDEDLNSCLSSATQKALLVTKIKVETCYFHCGKAFLRSQIWSPGCSYNKVKISFGQEISNNKGLEKTQVDSFDNQVEERYKKDL